MDNLFQSKWFIRVISLVFAITLYLFVTVETNSSNDDSRVTPGSSNEVQILDDVPVDIRIDAEQYVVSGVPEHVTVSLEGRTSVLTPVVRQRNFTVFVDLRDLTEGEHTVDIEYENLPDELTAYIEPKSIDINIEKRASKEFTVDIDYVNMDNFPLGYELGEAEINPSTVTIISSESIIEQIAMVKIFVDVTDLKESIRNREVPVSVYDIQGNDLNLRIEPATVIVSIPVDRPSKTVPLNVETTGELPDGYELDELDAPETLEIFGRRDVLNEIEVISTKQIDLSKVEASGEHEVELDFPEDVTANDEKITIEINLVQSRLFEDVNINVRGQGSEDIDFIAPAQSLLDITAKGRDELIRKLVKEDINVAIDIRDLDVGEHQVDLTVEGPENINFNPALSQVTIQVK